MNALSSLNKYFWKYSWLFLLGLIFVILTNYFRILAPQLTGYVVNTVTHQIKNDSLNSNNPVAHFSKNYNILVKKVILIFEKNPTHKILLAAITLFALAIISGLFMFLMRQTIIVMSRHIEYDQKNEIFNHYQNLDTNFYKTHSTGDLMNRISEDVSKVRMFTGPAIMYFINLAAVISFSVYFMLKASPKLTLVALAPLPILAITIFWVNTIINKKSEKIQALLSDLTTNAQESFSGIRVIKSYIQEKSMLAFFKSNSEAYRTNALSLAKTEAIYFPSMALIIGLSTIITIAVGCYDVINNGTDIGTIAEFVLYIQLLTFPVSAIGWTASMTQRAATSQKRINEFLHTIPQITNHNNVIKPILQGNISLQNVNFIYPHTGIKAIKNVSIQIKKGEKIAIIGRTGSGKTTLAQLLLRTYNISNGIINYDGIPINKIDMHWLREQISYVAQDVFLFSDTVKNNLKFGVPSANNSEIINAAKHASVHNEILKFDNGYDTMIGERGVTLSGGQKQRISIARALIKNPEIVIFDDCLSAVDARTENEIIENLYTYLQNKTAIIITHRIFSLFQFDKIIVLDKGAIVEEGTHQQLLQLNGLYTTMYKSQQIEKNN